jgi:hypothetical protein
VVAVLLLGKSFLPFEARKPKIDQHTHCIVGMTLGPVGPLRGCVCGVCYAAHVALLSVSVEEQHVT